MSMSNVFDNNKLYEIILKNEKLINNNNSINNNDFATIISLMKSNDKIKLLHLHPVLLCKLYNLKQKCIRENIINGLSKPLGNIQI